MIHKLYDILLLFINLQQLKLVTLLVIPYHSINYSAFTPQKL